MSFRRLPIHLSTKGSCARQLPFVFSRGTLSDMERKHFEQLVREGFALLPEWVRQKIDNVAILVEDEPSGAVRQAEELVDDETLLGYYHGIPLSERGTGYGVGMVLPDTITIYQVPIEEEAEGDPEKIKKVVADTVWHEVAHHFGMDEGEVHEREVRDGRS